MRHSEKFAHICMFLPELGRLCCVRSILCFFLSVKTLAWYFSSKLCICVRHFQIHQKLNEPSPLCQLASHSGSISFPLTLLRVISIIIFSTCSAVQLYCLSVFQLARAALEVCPQSGLSRPRRDGVMVKESIPERVVIAERVVWGPENDVNRPSVPNVVVVC